AQTKGRTVGLPQIPQNIDQLFFDVLPFDRRQIHRYGIKKFAIEYHSTNVARLFNNQSDPKEEYIIRYDPRDIREIYLWVEQENDYYVVPMKSSYSSRFKVNPQDPANTPLSLKELEAIKKHIREERMYGKRMSVSKYELVKGFEKRQKLIEDAIKKTKNAKRMRKKKENLHIYSTKATSSQIREKRLMEVPKNVSTNLDVEKDKEVDLEKIKERLKMKKFSTKEFPKKSINRRY
ncbi:MAG: Mu transposase C-terminal domain-containing protein, partial [Candidatus Odinarchaeota archaeon]